MNCLYFDYVKGLLVFIREWIIEFRGTAQRFLFIAMKHLKSISADLDKANPLIFNRCHPNILTAAGSVIALTKGRGK